MLRRRSLVSALLLTAVTTTASCALVPRNRRAQLADPTMAAGEGTLRERSHGKIHTVREGAAGGDGQAAGGGCGCSN